jgi:hypothetical protein
MGDGHGSRQLPRGTHRAALVMAVALACTACQSAPSAPAGSAQPGQATPSAGAVASDVTSGPAVDAARTVIDSANVADPDSISALSAIRFTDEGATAAAQAIQSGATGDVLWAATWVYGAAGTDPEVLLPLLSSTDSTIRALAAAPLLTWGKREGVDELVKLLSADGYVRRSAPPIRLADFAGGTLARFVKGPVIAADAPAADRAAAWTSWLAANESTMHYDPDTQTWSTP